MSSAVKWGASVRKDLNIRKTIANQSSPQPSDHAETHSEEYSIGKMQVMTGERLPERQSAEQSVD